MESNNMKRIMLAMGSIKETRLFRNNVAFAYVGRIVSKTPNTITLVDWRPLHAGLCKGSSDLIGWHTVEITPEMVGKKIAVFTAIEVKGEKGKASAEQVQFINAVNMSGGAAGVATTAEEAKKITQRHG
jgi:hypothetical protein